MWCTACELLSSLLLLSLVSAARVAAFCCLFHCRYSFFAFALNFPAVRCQSGALLLLLLLLA
jgi:hypothetical protein